MEITLIFVTLLSLGFALLLLAINWRLIREEHRRSAARVQALLEAVSTSSESVHIPVAERVSGPRTGVAEAPVGESPAPVEVSLKSRIPSPEFRIPRIDEPAASTPLKAGRSTTEAGVISSHELFHETAQAPSGFHRLALPASLGVLIVGAILSGFFLWNNSRGESTPPGSVAVAAANSVPVPLELISLRHERTGDGLSITGLVRNPGRGHLVSDVNVVVFMFDRNGAFITSARGPVDFRTLAPGDESPFVISLDKVGAVGRYRVSFRSHDNVVPHRDRRQDSVVAVATNQ